MNHYGATLTVNFVQSMLDGNSPLRKLQMSPNKAVFDSTVKAYHSFYALKNIPLLQEAYKYILMDMQVSNLARNLLMNY